MRRIPEIEDNSATPARCETQPCKAKVGPVVGTTTVLETTGDEIYYKLLWLISLAKKVVDRRRCLRGLPHRDTDLVETFHDVARSKQARYGGELVLVCYNAAEVAYPCP